MKIKQLPIIRHFLRDWSKTNKYEKAEFFFWVVSMIGCFAASMFGIEFPSWGYYALAIYIIAFLIVRYAVEKTKPKEEQDFFPAIKMGEKRLKKAIEKDMLRREKNNPDVIIQKTLKRDYTAELKDIEDKRIQEMI